MEATTERVLAPPAQGRSNAGLDPIPRRADEPRPPLRFGNYLSQTLSPFYQGVAEYAAERLGRPTELLTASRLSELAAGDVDVGFL